MLLYEKKSFSRKIFPLVLLGLLLVFYTFFLLTYMVPVTGGTDQNGYHVCAKMILKEGVCFQKPEDDLQFIGSMWVVNERGEFYPKYPPLYPLLASAMSRMLGDGGGFYATVWGAVLAVLGMFFLTRVMRFNGYWALLASLLLALSPVVTTLGITKNSHTPSLAMLIWGMTAFLLASTRKNRAYLPLASLGGFLIGYTVGIRYTDFLMILVPLSYGFLFLRKQRRIEVLACLLFGAAIPYTVLGLFHWQAYGAPWRSGYSLTEESGAFEPEFILTNLQIYLPEFFTSLLGPMAVFAFLFWKFRWRRAIFWSTWILPTFVLYLMYYWAPEAGGTGSMRFLVPLIPPVILLSLFALRKIGRSVGQKVLFGSSLAGLIVLQSLWGWMQTTRMCEVKYVSDLQAQLYVEFAKSRIPENSIILANQSFLNELDYEKRWTLYGSFLMNPREIQNMIRRSLDVQAAGLQHERAKLLDEKLGKMNYSQLQTFLRGFLERKRTAGREVYFIGRSWDANQFRRVFFRHFEVEKVALLTAMRPPWLLRKLKPDASRYHLKKGNAPVALPPVEIVKLGSRRAKVLTDIDSEKMLYAERSELMARLNPDRDPLIQDELSRLETIRDEASSIRRAVADRKRREELRRKQLLERQRKLEKKRALDREMALERKKGAEKKRASTRKKAVPPKKNGNGTKKNYGVPDLSGK